MAKSSYGHSLHLLHLKNFEEMLWMLIYPNNPNLGISRWSRDLLSNYHKDNFAYNGLLANEGSG